MSRTDDLSSLFTTRTSGVAGPAIIAGPGRSDVGFHQGQLVEFDNTTGTNQIRIGDTILTDVPLLGTVEAFALQPGDVVGVLRYKSQYFILGRIQVAGGDLTIRGGGINYVDGPAPPTPSAPVVTPIFQGLKVAWDGLFADDAAITVDWARVEVHVSDVDGFEPDPAVTFRAAIENPAGGEVTLAFPPDAPAQFVRLVSRSLAGKTSPASVQASGTPGTVDEFIGEIGSGTRIFYGPDEPVDPIEGELWFEEVTPGEYVIKRFAGGVWVELPSQEAADAVAQAVAAQATADTKVQTYSQDAEPAPPLVVGDLWIDTDNGNRVFRWDGSSWLPHSFGNGAIEPGSLIASDVIATGTISTALLEAQAVTADKMAVGTITAASGIIANAAITDANIQNLTASKITAGTLSAALLLSGAIRTATSGARVSLDSTGLKVFNASNAEIVSLLSSGSATFRGTVEAASSTGAFILIDPDTPELVAESDDGNSVSLSVVGSGVAGHIPQLLWGLSGWTPGRIDVDEDGGNQASLNLESPGVGAGNSASIAITGRNIAGPVPATVIELNAEFVNFQPLATLSLGTSESTENNFVINGRDQGRGMVANGWTTSTAVATASVAEAVAFSTGTINFRDGRAYMLTMKGLVRNATSANQVETRVRKGTTVAGMELLRSREVYCHQANRSYPYFFSSPVANTTGSTVATQLCMTYESVTSGGGASQLVATSTEPAYILVEDIGVASDYPNARQIT
jgi:hypothetical protein